MVRNPGYHLYGWCIARWDAGCIAPAGAQSCGPRRKPWGRNGCREQAPEGATEIHPLSSLYTNCKNALAEEFFEAAILPVPSEAEGSAAKDLLVL